MAKILIDGLQLSRYAFIVLYICAYARKSLYHHNKINWFVDLLEPSRLVYQGHPSSYFR
jgi:hypothetical protein